MITEGPMRTMNTPENSLATSTDVTVIVTSYNHQFYLEQCLDSIAAQTCTPAQVIVIDDFSQDDSADLIEHWLRETSNNYTFLRHERNLGLNSSLNEALAITDGRYFLHVSADDWAEPDRIERQLAAFEVAQEGTAIVVGDIREVNAGGMTIIDHDFSNRLSQITGADGQPDALLYLLAENVIPAPGVLLQTALVREIGGYDPSLSFEDYDLWLRLSVRYSIAYQPGIVANYRVVDSGLTRSPGRRVSILLSEAEMLAKHSGQSKAQDDVIWRRLVLIAGALLELQDSSAFRRVLGMAMAASDQPWLRRTRQASARRGGMERIRRDQAKQFGLAELASAK
jgi:glycosyltransferase involved in cell wall biosynthesis